MTWSYDISQLATSGLFRTRLRIGDTIEERQLLQNEEIGVILVEEPDLLIAASRCCDSIVAVFSRRSSETSDKLSKDWAKVVDQYRKLAIDLKNQATLGVDWLVGGIDRNEEVELARDSSALQPSFRIGQDNNPRALDRRRTTRQGFLPGIGPF